jgi:hypothetical protein
MESAMGFPRRSFAFATVGADIVVFLGAGKYNPDAPQAFSERE